MLQQWVDALPFANPALTLSALGKELGALDRARVKPTRRAELLDIHAQAYGRLSDVVLRPSAQLRGALPASVREVAANVSDEIARGYERVVLELGEEPKKWFSRNSKVLARAVQRAGLFICFSVLQTYSRYQSPKTGQLARLAALYRFAAERKLADWSEPVRDLPAEFATSLARLFKACALASAVDPHGLGPGQVWSLFALLCECGDGMTISEGPPARDARGLFVVDPRGRRRTMSLASAQVRGIPDDVLLLDPSAMVDPLRERLSRIVAGDASDSEQPYWRDRDFAIIERVLRTISKPRKRSQDRHPLGAEVRIVTGVRAIQRLLGGPQIPVQEASFTSAGDAVRVAVDPSPQLAAEDQMKMIDPHTGGTVDVAVEFGAGGRGRVRDAAEPRAEDGGGSVSARSTLRTDKWIALDVAEQGIGVVTHTAPEIVVGVGQVAAVALPDESWRVGVVRWMKCDGGSVHGIGIEFLEGTVEAIALRERKADGADPGQGQGVIRPALELLPARRGVAPALLAPLGTLARGPRFEVRRADTSERRSVKAVAPFAETAYFERFAFEYDDRDA